MNLKIRRGSRECKKDPYPTTENPAFQDYNDQVREVLPRAISDPNLIAWKGVEDLDINVKCPNVQGYIQAWSWDCAGWPFVWSVRMQ